MRQKFVGILLVLIVVFTGCVQHIDKEADYKNKVKLFSEQYPHINIELLEVKEKNGEFVGRFRV